VSIVWEPPSDISADGLSDLRRKCQYLAPRPEDHDLRLTSDDEYSARGSEEEDADQPSDDDHLVLRSADEEEDRSGDDAPEPVEENDAG
jgi:hypothetical protein